MADLCNHLVNTKYPACFRYTVMNKHQILRSLNSEKLATQLRHKNITAVYAVRERTDPAFVVMEYVGTLTHYFNYFSCMT